MSMGGPQSIERIIGFEGRIHVVDIGAAAINEMPPYKRLIDRGLARLSAVDADERQIDSILQAYGAGTQVINAVIADGSRRQLYLCSPASGMSSILKPSERNLAFFNGFTGFGRVQRVIEVETRRLADIEALQAIDFLKMDVQGAELMVLENSGKALDDCVAIHLEASFVTLYEDQPSLGEIDIWMRSHGFLPHRFIDVKRWSIAPVLRENDFRLPFHQLLECDIVYVRALVDLSGLDDDQLRKLALIAAYVCTSPDLTIHAARELERRGAIAAGSVKTIFASHGNAASR
jgi:FkbM family methyltransferase